MRRGVSEKRYLQLDEWAEKHRNNPTPAESKLLKLIQGRWWNVWRFQCVRDHYILDFYCKTHKLAVEIDGGYHTTPDRMEYDAKRERILRQYHDIRVLRFTNEQVLTNPREVMATIEAAMGIANGRYNKPKRKCAKYKITAEETAILAAI